MTESYIIPEFDENGNFLSDDVKARIVEMIESNIIPEFDENGNILRDDVKARIVEMIEDHAPTPVLSNPGPEVITLDEGHPNLAGSLAEPLPDDLPVGSYLVNEPRFMGYRLSQKTPFGWDLKDFEATINYSSGVSSTMTRVAVMRDDGTPVEGANLTGTVTSTADGLNISFSIWGSANFTKGEEVMVLLEGPQYALDTNTAVYHEYVRGGTEGPEGVTHYVNASSTSFSIEEESTKGLRVRVIVGRDQNGLKINAAFGLRSLPDMRPYDARYAPPSERVEVEVPEPTFVEADDHMSGTVTIPEVEGVTWRLSYQYASVEPGVYEVQAADRQHFSVHADAKKGYRIKNDDASGVPWRTSVQWSYKLGIPITAPTPAPLSATTVDGVEGWIVRYPEVEHASYYFLTGMYPSVKTVLTGDTFTPTGKRISAEVTGLPYYLTKTTLGTLRADGTIS